MILLQADTIERILNIETISVIGLLLAICALLIYDKVRKEKAYSELQNKLTDEQNENKKMLIELVSKSILATEQNTTAIKTLRDVYNQRN
jgi:predicted histidine transporter YuiF (NhaC family)